MPSRDLFEALYAIGRVGRAISMAEAAIDELRALQGELPALLDAAADVAHHRPRCDQNYVRGSKRWMRCSAPAKWAIVLQMPPPPGEKILMTCGNHVRGYLPQVRVPLHELIQRFSDATTEQA
jgi:hypothetical protein